MESGNANFNNSLRRYIGTLPSFCTSSAAMSRADLDNEIFASFDVFIFSIAPGWAPYAAGLWVALERSDLSLLLSIICKLS